MVAPKRVYTEEELRKAENDDYERLCQLVMSQESTIKMQWFLIVYLGLMFFIAVGLGSRQTTELTSPKKQLSYICQEGDNCDHQRVPPRR